MTSTQRAVRVATLVALPVGLVLTGCGDDSVDEQVFCTAEAMLYPDGESYGRSGSRGCQFVESDGSLLEVTADGEPLCYDSRYDGPDGQSVGGDSIWAEANWWIGWGPIPAAAEATGTDPQRARRLVRLALAATLAMWLLTFPVASTSS